MTVQSAFESEVETYRDAMDALHETAGDQQASLESLDDAMGSLRQSVTEMTAAVDEYDDALERFDEAVVSLGEHATGSDTRTAPTTDPIAGD